MTDLTLNLASIALPPVAAGIALTFSGKNFRNQDADSFHSRRIQFLLLQQRPHPIHVPVRKGGGEAVFEVEDEIVLRESVGLKTKELRKAEGLAESHKELIIQKWHEHFN